MRGKPDTKGVEIEYKIVSHKVLFWRGGVFASISLYGGELFSLGSELPATMDHSSRVERHNLLQDAKQLFWVRVPLGAFVSAKFDDRFANLGSKLHAD
eukprot:CAMPEP_0184508884 /NCGR_PEP_ID=MMETSP0198_2-20121128/991_1 /TAXON_ID=1112570 /ORGANISM="Thraustochytrium sp., Strain LLF1b" /LENGTH=97 /DNA_ID=CAMNT_0026898683 /DNA_START=366 /DNA_END=659 /DNA_ORIENTATION=+